MYDLICGRSRRKLQLNPEHVEESIVELPIHSVKSKTRGNRQRSQHKLNIPLKIIFPTVATNQTKIMRGIYRMHSEDDDKTFIAYMMALSVPWKS